MFVKLTNGQPSKFPYTLGDLRRDNPYTSFPRIIPSEMLASYDVYPVCETSLPSFSNFSHRVQQTVEQINGVWVQVWNNIELPADQATANVRAQRDRLLQETDWIVSRSYEAGRPVAQDWVAYRQALRDIPEQEGFPYLIQWPTQP